MSKAGTAWKKQEYVLETFDSYPKKVKFDFFGDRVDQYPMGIGDILTRRPASVMHMVDNVNTWLQMPTVNPRCATAVRELLTDITDTDE